MNLSEAMRIGAAKHPPGFGHYVDFAKPELPACALGAALIGKCGLDGAIKAAAFDEFPALHDSRTNHVCPKCELIDDLFTIITHLNDEHFEPRERIADWLEEQGL